MEGAMTESHTIRRHPDGSIDFAFYRAGATALRRQAMRDAATLRTAWMGGLAMAGVLAVTVMLAATPMATPKDPLAVAQAGVSQTR
jgi:hypothetical protein